MHSISLLQLQNLVSPSFPLRTNRLQETCPGLYALVGIFSCQSLILDNYVSLTGAYRCLFVCVSVRLCVTRCRRSMTQPSTTRMPSVSSPATSSATAPRTARRAAAKTCACGPTSSPASTTSTRTAAAARTPSRCSVTSARPASHQRDSTR